MSRSRRLTLAVVSAATGIAGLSIEDSTGDLLDPLHEFDLAVERVRAARRAIDEREGYEEVPVADRLLEMRPARRIRRRGAATGAEDSPDSNPPPSG